MLEYFHFTSLVYLKEKISGSSLVNYSHLVDLSCELTSEQKNIILPSHPPPNLFLGSLENSGIFSGEPLPSN